MKQRYQALRGTRDILPDEIPRWQFVERTARSVLPRFGFREIRTPLIESTELFARSVGSSTDIVRKEMYAFEMGDEAICLRPESTASVVRAFVEHALYREVAKGYPERYFYIGPMFRYERPQRGRQRQFHQIGVEVLGADEPLADAETIQMVGAFLDELGIAERELVLNSVGDAACRPGYRQALVEWLEPRLASLCEDCRRRFAENPLRVFDCKVDEDRQLLRQAPTLLDRLCAPCSEHFAAVRGALDLLDVPHRIDPRMVRGLDYYQRTVFEVLHGELGAQNAILGGGRYDGLVEELGGPAVPGFGFAIGLERLVLLMPPERGVERGADLAVICLGSEVWDQAVRLTQRFRTAGVATLMPLVERPLGAQMRRADKAGVRFVLFIGRDELALGRFGLKDLRTGEQQALGEAEVLARVGGNHGR